MPLKIIQNDITTLKVDAIVNAANESLLGGGGVDGCIHRAAGPGLLAECRTLNGCRTGSAKITGAYNLPCEYVIHTVGPIWHGGKRGEKDLLTSCYRTSLQLAAENHCETVAFPLISAGVYRYPKDQALRVAVDTITEFLKDHDMTVYIVIFNKQSFQIRKDLLDDVAQYIEENYEDLSEYLYEACQPAPQKRSASVVCESSSFAEPPLAASMPSEPAAAYSLESAVAQLDESFTEMLLKKIDELGMTDAECYKKANVDRKLFSKIRKDPQYKPSKPTALAFAIALELPLEEVQDLLMKAGFALSHSNKFDVIIEFFIKDGNYNIYEINEALFAFDQSLLGA